MASLHDSGLTGQLARERHDEAAMERAAAGASREGYVIEEPPDVDPRSFRGVLSTGVAIVVGTEAISRLLADVVDADRWILSLAVLALLLALWNGPSAVRAVRARRLAARERDNGLGI
jgi:hypothetical protein